MNLVVKSPVWSDLREIGLRIARDNPDAADRFFTAAKEAFDLLTQHPSRAPAKFLTAGRTVVARPRF